MSIAQFLHRGKEMYPERKALIFEGRTTTYGQLFTQASTLAGALAGLGIEEEDRVGILAANSDRAIVCFYSAVWAGFIPNYLNIRWSLYELSAALHDCTPSVLVVDDLFLEAGLQLRDRCPSIRVVIYIGTSTDLPEGVLPLEHLLATSQAIEDRSSTGDHTAFLNYTGGTSGKGKGVVHSHASHIEMAISTMAEGVFHPGVCGLTVPLFHISGIATASTNLMFGNTLVIAARYEPLGLLELIQSQGIQQAFLVPTMLKMLVDHPAYAEYDISCLKYVRYGGSPIDETLLLQLREEMPWVNFLQLYGQTEFVPATLLHNYDHSPEGVAAGRTRSAGLPCYGVDVEIRDPAGEPLPAGGIGEIALRGARMMKRYWNNPEQTSQAMVDGWLLTGDAGYIDEDGYLFVVDRVKDMIVSGGENIYSLEVEDAICRHPAVQQCAVVGVADDKWGERVHAEVVLKAEQDLSMEQLIVHCRQYLAGYKLPRSVNFVNSLPLTAVGKLDKVAMRNRISGR